MFVEQGIVPVPLTRHEDGSLQQPGSGEIYDSETVLDPGDWRGFAWRLARWHMQSPVISAGSNQGPAAMSKEASGFDQSGSKEGNTEIDAGYQNQEGQGVRDIWSVMKDWVEQITDDAWTGKDIKNEMRKEIEWAFGRLGSKADLVEHKLAVPHCNLLAGSKVVQTSKEHGETVEVQFFDYECGVACRPAFAIATYFGAWAGFECDYTKTPSPVTRRNVIKEYVRPLRVAKLKRRRERSHLDNDEIMNELVDEFRGLAGLWFGLWALVLAHESGEVFDYRHHVKLRLSEYYVWKGVEPLLGFGEGNADARIRERRWFNQSLGM